MKTGWQTFAKNPPPIGERIMVYIESADGDTYWTEEADWDGNCVHTFVFMFSDERILLWRPMPPAPKEYIVEAARELPLIAIDRRSRFRAR